MKIGFRADASLILGSGHIMRCLTLADQCRRAKWDVYFFSEDVPGNMCAHLESRNYQVSRLQLSGNRGLKTMRLNWRQDVDSTKEALGDQRLDVMVVDHYGLGASWHSSIRSHAKHVMVIDDLYNRKIDADVLLDQNLIDDRGRYNNLVPRRCQKLLGPKFALLRPQFREARQFVRKKRREVKRVFAFFGGVDATNELSKTLQALEPFGRKGLHVDAVYGASYLRSPELKKKWGRQSWVHLSSNVSNMANVMKRSDLAVGAAGVTTWERACVGLPTLMIAVASNQVSIAKSVHRHKAGIYLGSHEKVSVEKIRRAYQQVSEDSQLIDRLRSNSFSLTDGRGVQRVMATLKNL